MQIVTTLCVYNCPLLNLMSNRLRGILKRPYINFKYIKWNATHLYTIPYTENRRTIKSSIKLNLITEAIKQNKHVGRVIVARMRKRWPALTKEKLRVFLLCALCPADRMRSIQKVQTNMEALVHMEDCILSRNRYSPRVNLHMIFQGRLFTNAINKNLNLQI